jgi:hypothetical protein
MSRGVLQRGTVDGSWLIRRGDREETAQVVVRRSIKLAAGDHLQEVGGLALDLLRVANHDATTLEHALVVCRSLARDDPTDVRVTQAIRLLERVTTFLGVPRPQSTASTPGR